MLSRKAMDENCTICPKSITQMILMCADPDQLDSLIVKHNLVLQSINCPKCLKPATKSRDGFFRCQRVSSRNKAKKCNFMISIYQHSIFGDKKIVKTKLLQFVAWYLCLPPPQQMRLMEELNISKTTYTILSEFVREVLIIWAEETQEIFGGEGKVVKIDEAKFGKRKYNRGRIVEGQWVFGGVERGSKKCFFVPVPRRNKETLLGVIKKWILQGTTIISDCWKAYECLEDEGLCQGFMWTHSESPEEYKKHHNCKQTNTCLCPNTASKHPPTLTNNNLKLQK